MTYEGSLGINNEQVNGEQQIDSGIRRSEEAATQRNSCGPKFGTVPSAISPCPYRISKTLMSCMLIRRLKSIFT